jgi:hypothetical protein
MHCHAGYSLYIHVECNGAESLRVCMRYTLRGRAMVTSLFPLIRGLLPVYSCLHWPAEGGGGRCSESISGARVYHSASQSISIALSLVEIAGEIILMSLFGRAIDSEMECADISRCGGGLPSWGKCSISVAFPSAAKLNEASEWPR